MLLTRLRIRILIDDRPELHILRDMLMHKYGREFAIAVMENRDGCVSERVSSMLFFVLCVRSHAVVLQITKKLAYLTPAPELVDAYLSEIARGYNVHWAPPERLSAKNDTDESTTDFGGGGGLKVGVFHVLMSRTFQRAENRWVNGSGSDTERRF